MGAAAIMHNEPGVAAYRARVCTEMYRRYGSVWDDVCGDDHPLIRASEAGRTPAEFVEWWGEKYALLERPAPARWEF